MLSQKLSIAELMITMVKLKSITTESAAGADRSVSHGVFKPVWTGESTAAL